MSGSAKIMLLGAIGVGKTSLAKRFAFDRFDSDYKTTIGVNILTHDTPLPPEANGETLRLVLWDTDGDFGQTLFSASYILGASGAVIVADATRERSVANMLDLATEFEARFSGRPVACVINKIDLVDAPPPETLRGRDILASSALSGAGVATLFETIGAAVWRRGLHSR